MNDTDGNVAFNLRNQANGDEGKMDDQPKGGNVKKDHVWFVLIASCVTPALVVALGSAILFTSGAVAFAGTGGAEPVMRANQEADNPGERVFAGMITDDHCGARHDMDSGKNSAECTRMCVRNGSKYVLIEGNQRYALAGGENEFARLAGQRAKIAGTLDGNTIRVGSTGSGH